MAWLSVIPTAHWQNFPTARPLAKVVILDYQAASRDELCICLMLPLLLLLPPQYPDVNHGTVNGKPIREVLADSSEWLDGEFITVVQQRGAAIIKVRSNRFQIQIQIEVTSLSWLGSCHSSATTPNLLYYTCRGPLQQQIPQPQPSSCRRHHAVLLHAGCFFGCCWCIEKKKKIR